MNSVKIDSTIEDGRNAKIFAKELHIYFQRPVQERKVSENILKWTGTKVALIELIYALQIAGVFNNGTADIKQLTSALEELFSIELGNVYNAFQEMRLRKKNRSSFLDLLKERLIQRMDEADENF